MTVDCLFCRITTGDVPASVVRDDAHTLAFRDVNPQAPTHVLVIPKEHFPNVGALVADNPALLADVISAGTAVARDEGIAKTGYRLVFNTGQHGGQTVDHVHLHVLGGRSLTWPPG